MRTLYAIYRCIEPGCGWRGTRVARAVARDCPKCKGEVEQCSTPRPRGVRSDVWR